jgi:cysteine-rich repeat protein
MTRWLLLVFLFLAPAAFACATRGDGVCDCGCGTVDPDCGEGFGFCQRNHCPPGQVPWEHQPETCMTSACGDGWRDERTGEVCDDADALARGGCSADCKQVNAGFSCGERASGCVRHTDGGVDAGVDAGVGGPVDAGLPLESKRQPQEGCSTTLGLASPALVLLWRRRSRR